LRSAIGLRQYCDADACDGRLGGEEYLRFETAFCVDRPDTGGLLLFAAPFALGVVGRGGIEGVFFLEELSVEFEFDAFDWTVEEDGYSFWLSLSLDRLDRRELFFPCWVR
jgi:hypothetical protein